MSKNSHVRVSKRGKKVPYSAFQIGKMIFRVESITSSGSLPQKSQIQQSGLLLPPVYLSNDNYYSAAKQAIYAFYKQLCRSTTKCIFVKNFQLHLKIATIIFWLQLKHFSEAIKAAAS